MEGRSAGVRAGDPGSRPGPLLRQCPRCGGGHLRLVEITGGPNLLCIGCRRCWHFEDGHVVEVNPYACSGCAERTLCRVWTAPQRSGPVQIDRR